MSAPPDNLVAKKMASPVRDKGEDNPQPGIGLCLSGGGYRAMVFHLGALLRLNEMGYLAKLDRISSVSGGSITAGFLGLQWKNLNFTNGKADNLTKLVIDPIRRFAHVNVDIPSVLKGIFLPGTISDKVANRYDKHLFKGATLQDLPPDPPRFVINATNVQSGVLWRFSRPYMRDYLVGEVKNPTLSLARAVAASSAFPPFLSPARIRLNPADVSASAGEPYHKPPYTEKVFLSDGGVYDNLGLETVWKRYKTILVSDAGLDITGDPTPATDWLLHTKRVLDIIDNQVCALRTRQVVSAFIRGDRSGAFWSVRSDIENYGLKDHLPCPVANTAKLARMSTRLSNMPDQEQARLINWGYAICDAAVRRWVDSSIEPPSAFPYPGGV